MSSNFGEDGKIKMKVKFIDRRLNQLIYLYLSKEAYQVLKNGKQLSFYNHKRATLFDVKIKSTNTSDMEKSQSFVNGSRVWETATVCSLAEEQGRLQEKASTCVINVSEVNNTSIMSYLSPLPLSVANNAPILNYSTDKENRRREFCLAKARKFVMVKWNRRLKARPNIRKVQRQYFTIPKCIMRRYDRAAQIQETILNRVESQTGGTGERTLNVQEGQGDDTFIINIDVSGFSAPNATGVERDGAGIIFNQLLAMHENKVHVMSSDNSVEMGSMLKLGLGNSGTEVNEKAVGDGLKLPTPNALVSRASVRKDAKAAARKRKCISETPEIHIQDEAMSTIGYAMSFLAQLAKRTCVRDRSMGMLVENSCTCGFRINVTDMEMDASSEDSSVNGA